MEAGYLVVARFAKPHGLKGEAIVFVLTDRPEEIFVPGRALTPLDDAGRPLGPALTLERARPYHRRWLLKFTGLDARSALEGWPTQRAFGVPAATIADDSDTRLYEHEVPGATVVVDGQVVGTARELLPVPGGQVLVLEREGREVLVPFRPPILVRTDRTRREIEIDPPPGLLEP